MFLTVLDFQKNSSICRTFSDLYFGFIFFSVSLRLTVHVSIYKNWSFQVYILGGLHAESQSVLSYCHRFDPTNCQWSSVSPMLTGRCRFATVVIGSTIYVSGKQLRWNIWKRKYNKDQDVYSAVKYGGRFLCIEEKKGRIYQYCRSICTIRTDSYDTTITLPFVHYFIIIC